MAHGKNENSKGSGEPQDTPKAASSESRIPSPESRGSVNRRHVLRVIGSVPAAALIPITPALAEKPKPAHAPPAPTAAEPAGPYQPKVFNEREWKTINVLSDIIIPADGRSGSATAAGVPEFIDDWLGFVIDDWWGFATGGSKLLPVIRGGLTWLDMECNRQFGRDFLDCSDPQKKQILDRIAYPKKAALEDAPGVAFFTQLRNLVVSGFFSSRMGVEDLPYLGNTVVADWQGCPSEVLAKLGLEKGVGSGE